MHNCKLFYRVTRVASHRYRSSAVIGGGCVASTGRGEGRDAGVQTISRGLCGGLLRFQGGLLLTCLAASGVLIQRTSALAECLVCLPFTRTSARQIAKKRQRHTAERYQPYRHVRSTDGACRVREVSTRLPAGGTSG